MSDDEARNLVEALDAILASSSHIERRERILRVADWISRRQMEGKAGGERDRGDKRVMEYSILGTSWMGELEDMINARSSKGYALREILVISNSDFYAIMERERAQGT